MGAPDDAPAECPVCHTDYESVSVHYEGVAVNLLENERYRRICFEPVDGDDGPLLRFYHHNHEQVGTGKPGTPGGRVP